MRHNKNFNHLSRKKAHRDALLANMTIALIERKRIFTTLAKAKALRMYAEPLINRAKEDTMANRRLVFSHLQNKYAVTELFREIAEKIADRPGGYQQTVVHSLGVAMRDALVGREKGHIRPDMAEKVLILLIGQLDDPFHLDTDRCFALFLQ